MCLVFFSGGVYQQWGHRKIAAGDPVSGGRAVTMTSTLLSSWLRNIVLQPHLGLPCHVCLVCSDSLDFLENRVVEGVQIPEGTDFSTQLKQSTL